MPAAQDIITGLLTQGKLKAALEATDILCKHYEDTERIVVVRHQAARYQTLMREYHAGTVGDDDYRIERAKINMAMLDLAQNLPAHWTNAILHELKFNPNAWDETTSTPARTNRTWIWVAGIAGLALASFGIWKLMTPAPIPTDTAVAKQEPTTTTQQPATSTQPGNMPPPVTTNTTPANNSPQKQGNTSPATTKPTNQPKPETQPAQTPTTSSSMATPDHKFRSFGKTVIANDMELGMMGEKMAFRNVRTKQVICCFKDATHFSGGKAYVSRDGVKYFYINTQGQEVPE